MNTVENDFETAVATKNRIVSRANIRLGASLMCADGCNLAREVELLEQGGVDTLHIDLMDAHYVPNMPLGLATLAQLRSCTSLPFDVHLMVDKNEWFINEVHEIGVQSISVHVESTPHLDRTLQQIRQFGIKAGAALNPATPLAVLDYVHGLLDFVLIMTVNPGFAGQQLTHSALRKIRDCSEYVASRKMNIPIQVDGNVSFSNIPLMVKSGATDLVCGSSSVFHKSGTYAENIQKVRDSIYSVNT